MILLQFTVEFNHIITLIVYFKIFNKWILKSKVIALEWWRPSVSSLLLTHKHTDYSCALPCFFMAALACLTASQGLGMSRKTASATPVTPNPSLHTSWFLTVTRWSTRCSLNSSAAFSDRCWWNSTVCRWPVGAMVRSIAWEREPLPVPTMQTAQEGWEQQQPRYSDVAEMLYMNSLGGLFFLFFLNIISSLTQHLKGIVLPKLKVHPFATDHFVDGGCGSIFKSP